MKQYIDKGFKAVNFAELIEEENIHQLAKWGNQIHSLFEWLAYTTEELGELSKAISEFEYREGSIREIIKEAAQTATLCLKIADMVGNDKFPTEIDKKMFGNLHQPKQGGL